MVVFSQNHMDRLRGEAVPEDPLVEFERALKDWDAAMKRLIAATIKLKDAREPANAKWNW